VAEELRAAVDRIDRIQEQANQRLDGGHHDGEQPGTVAMMFFEDVAPEDAAPAASQPVRPARQRR
jgi:hypothetical protein